VAAPDNGAGQQRRLDSEIAVLIKTQALSRAFSAGNLTARRGLLRKFFQPHISALILTIAFVVAIHFFLLSYGRYMGQRVEVAAMDTRVQQLQRQKLELERKKRTLMQVSRFMAEVRSLGLAKENWTFYNVNIEEPKRFYEAQEILRQCTHSTGYYFKPLGLSIRTPLATETESEATPPPGPSPVMEGVESGDVLLKLRGAFVARHQ
jgi:hypothetical protein